MFVLTWHYCSTDSTFQVLPFFSCPVRIEKKRWNLIFLDRIFDRMVGMQKYRKDNNKYFLRIEASWFHLRNWLFKNGNEFPLSLSKSCILLSDLGDKSHESSIKVAFGAKTGKWEFLLFLSRTTPNLRPLSNLF